MRETVTIVLKINAEAEDWEVYGVYVSVEDAENAISYCERGDAERNDDRYTYAKTTMPVLTFPEWVR